MLETKRCNYLKPFGFAGRQRDRDKSLVCFGGGHYNPSTGRFMQKDPIGFAGGDTNLYRYCVNDPINCIDPSGLLPVYRSYEDLINLDIQTEIVINQIDQAYGGGDTYVNSTLRSASSQQRQIDLRRTTSGPGVPYRNISQHVTGTAADIYVPGVSSSDLADTARNLGATGTISYRPDQGGHTHIDTRPASNRPYHSRRNTCP